MKDSLKFSITLLITLLVVIVTNIDWFSIYYSLSKEKISLILTIWLYYEMAFALMYFSDEEDSELVKWIGDFSLVVIVCRVCWRVIAPFLDKILK